MDLYSIFSQQIFLFKLIGFKLTYKNNKIDKCLKAFAFFNIAASIWNFVLSVHYLIVKLDSVQLFIKNLSLVISHGFYVVRAVSFFVKRKQYKLLIDSLLKMIEDGN